jgi:hypothetical protein
MKTRFSIIALLGVCACANVEDATPSERKTFIRFYEAPHNVAGITAEPVDDGFVILASEATGSGANAGTNGLLIRTDKNGAETGARVVLPRLLPTALKRGPTAYWVTGDRVQINSESPNVFDFSISSAMLYRISLTGNDTVGFRTYDQAADFKTDFRGSSVTISPDNEVILLGTFKEAKAVAFERPFITALDPQTLDTVWVKRYDALERDYVNGKSIFTDASGNIIWATALLREAGDLSRTFLAMPFVQEGSVFVNNDLFGETTDQKLLATDLQPNFSPQLGFGLIGTFAQPTGGSANMFFVRVDKSGNFIPGSDRYFDGGLLIAENRTAGAAESSSQDTGDAITSTRDGGFILAGTIESTPNLGRGGKDILLVKVTATGSVVWSKLLGGAGNETVSSIRETADGGLLLCGTNEVSQLSSIFIIKTDAEGNLND